MSPATVYVGQDAVVSISRTAGSVTRATIDWSDSHADTVIDCSSNVCSEARRPTSGTGTLTATMIVTDGTDTSSAQCSLTVQVGGQLSVHVHAVGLH